MVRMDDLNSLQAQVDQVLKDAFELVIVIGAKLNRMSQDGNAAGLADHLQSAARRYALFVEISQPAGREISIEGVLNGRDVAFALKNPCDVRPTNNSLRRRILAALLLYLLHGDRNTQFLTPGDDLRITIVASGDERAGHIAQDFALRVDA